MSDADKFIKISRDPTHQINNKLNKIVIATNCVKDAIHFSKLVGNYSPHYIYGNVKTYKRMDGSPFRPIISQDTTPTYSIGNSLII